MVSTRTFEILVNSLYIQRYVFETKLLNYSYYYYYYHHHYYLKRARSRVRLTRRLFCPVRSTHNIVLCVRHVIILTQHKFRLSIFQECGPQLMILISSGHTTTNICIQLWIRSAQHLLLNEYQWCCIVGYETV